MGSFSIWHWLIVLLIVVLIFGTKKLKNIGTDLGGAVKGFKDGVQRRHGARRTIRPSPTSRSAAPRSAPTPTRSTSKRRPSREQPDAAPRQRRARHDRLRLRQARADRRRGADRHRPGEAAARRAHRRHLLGKAQRYVADVKAEVNRSIELEELKKMKTEFEDAARNVEQTVSSEMQPDHQPTCRPPGSRRPTRRCRRTAASTTA